MLTLRTIAAVALSLAALAGATAAAPLRIHHTPAAQAPAYAVLVVEAVLPGDLPPERVGSAEILVADLDGSLRAIPLSFSRGVLFGEIPASLLVPPAVRYFFRLVDTDGETVTAPSSAQDGGFFVVPVAGTAADDSAEGAFDDAWTASSVEILSPSPGEVVATATPIIAAVFRPPLDEPWDALVTLDGRDVSGDAEITSDLLVLSPPDSLGAGAHRITFSAVTPTRTVDASWTFYVKEMLVGDAWAPLASSRLGTDERSAPEWDFVGRVEVGWAYVAADTTEADSLDVFLSYDEVSRPTVDVYASGTRGDRSILLTAEYNPLYDDRLDWFLDAGSGHFDLECGSVFPSLSRTTLDWTPGLGAVLTARAGPTTTRLVGMRMSEADTLAGFGIYSRFAAAASGTYDWSEGLGASLIYLAVFDREQSVPEEERLAEPLRNDVAAALVRARRGRLEGELELSRSSSSGDYDGTGVAFRARAGVEKDLDNRVFVEYLSTGSDFYSAGSFEAEPGKDAIEIEFAYRPNETLRTSGGASAALRLDDRTSIVEDEYEFGVHGRAELLWTAFRGDARTYAAARYDLTPYESYDYIYTYGAVGGSWQRGGTRVVAGLSLSRARSIESSDTWTTSVDLRRELLPRLWTVRVAGRWTLGSGGDETDYARTQYTLESRLRLGGIDLETEYWFIEREDRADVSQSHTEHVVTAGLGRSF